MSEVKLTYGKDAEGRLQHILHVPNGLTCQCTCPGCGAPLVAKNQGANHHPHFAHASGTACHGAHESELHLLAKEILAEEKAVMLPPYGRIYPGGLQRFAAMEVEERNDHSMLQPDVVGIQHNPLTNEPARLWIEVRVTHEIGPEKYQRIKELDLPCIEIDLSLYHDEEVTRETIRRFLLDSKEHRQWINNPVLQKRLESINEQRRTYAQNLSNNHAQAEHGTSSKQTDIRKNASDVMAKCADGTIMPKDRCLKCPHHSTRQALLQEMTLQKIPTEYKQLILRHPLSWLTSSPIAPMPSHPSDYIITIGNDTLYLPTCSPDIYGNTLPAAKIAQNHRVITFFQQTLPSLIQTSGNRCDNLLRYIPAEDGTLYIVCKERV